MQTSRFQLTLNTLLSAGLGAALLAAFGAGDAGGYPAGAAVSLATNPVVSFAGTLTSSDTATITSVSSDRDLVITDVVLSSGDSGAFCRSSIRVEVLAGGSAIGKFGIGVTNETRSYSSWEPTMVASLNSGLRVSAGSTLQIVTSQDYQDNCSGSGPDLHYTLSGYYAQS